MFFKKQTKKTKQKTRVDPLLISKHCTYLNNLSSLLLTYHHPSIGESAFAKFALMHRKTYSYDALCMQVFSLLISHLPYGFICFIFINSLFPPQS